MPATSPRPDEPDVHVRLVWDGAGDPLVLDYRACVSAATAFLADWTRSHSPQLRLLLVDDDPAGLPRMKCEYLWSSPC